MCSANWSIARALKQTRITRPYWHSIVMVPTAGIPGTSMATPQVAGLAAYLWSIPASLSVADLRDIIVRSDLNNQLDDMPPFNPWTILLQTHP